MEWSHPHPVELVVALALGLGGLLLLARRAARSPDARSLVLVAARASALVVLVLILLDPARVVTTQVPGERPKVVYLTDGSRSMGLERPESRGDHVARLQAEAESSVVPDRRPAIERYRFGTRLAALGDGEPAGTADDESRLAEALERLPARFGDDMPLGVVVFSDGRVAEPGGLDEVAAAYRRLGVPIHVVPVGDPAIAGDVAIRDLIVPRSAPAGTKVPVEVRVGSRGFDGRRVEVAIRPADGTPEARPLATLPLTLLDGEQSARLVVESDRAKGPLVAEVAPLPGEAVAENNRVPFRIGSRERRVRALYMEGSPNPEYHYIRDALVEDPNFECVALETDFQNNASPRLHRVDDPARGYPTTREELLSFDVVICSDIARAAFTPEQLQWTVELVGKRGGGFAMVGGYTSFGSGGWDRTSWDGMIPIDMSGAGPGRASEYYNGDFRVVVPAGVDSHPIWRIVDDPARNREVLAGMPAFHGTNLTERLKPAATLLGVADRPLAGMDQFVTVPVRPGRSGSPAKRPAVDPGGPPIFSCQAFGRGRSFAMSTDSTVAWGTDFERSWGESDNRYFRKFWRNVVAWLAENSTASSRLLDVTTDKVIYRPGQPILVQAQSFGTDLEPNGRHRLAARLVLGGAAPAVPSPPDTPEWPLTYRPESRDYAAAVPAPAADRARGDSGATFRDAVLEVTAYDGDEVVGRSIKEVQILDDSEEFRDPRPDTGPLERLARQSGGQVLAGPAELADRLGQSPGAAARTVRSSVPAWDSPLVMAAIFLPLVAEWIIRRCKGLA